MTQPTHNSDPARNALLALRTEIAKVVVGQDAVVSGLVIALLCRGHVLLEGVPGVAKTLLVRTLAAALQLEFKRVQFTPDLMPGDVTGSLVYDARTAEFEFRSGPVFTNLLLADEINRTPPKTQAALLEAMEERQVSVEGEARPLPDPFIVAATQNPIEYEGTYQLPEAQLDRFLLKLNVPLPPRDEEITILDRHARGFDPRDLSAVQSRRGNSRVGGGPRGGSSGARRRRGARVYRRHCRCHKAFTVPAARCVPAWRDGAVGDGPVLGMAVRSHLRHPRRRQGDGTPDVATPNSAAAGGRTRGCQSRRRVGRHSRGRAGTPLVILTGRAGLAALICVLPIAVAPWPAIVFGILLAALTAAVVLDIALAAGTRRLQFSRSGDTAARLGQPVDAVLVVENTGSRRFAGVIRDAWAPSARAEPRTHAVNLPSGQRAGVVTTFRPVRRGDQVSALVTARSIGPLGLAGRQNSHRVPWQIRILPPFLSRKHLPSRLAKLRELEGNTPMLIRGQGTEFDSLREYVIGDDVRSIDWRASARRADVVVRTWRPERDQRVVIVLDTGRTSAGRVGVDPTSNQPGGWPRLDWSMDAALLLAALASRAGDHVDFLAYDRDTRAGVFNATRTELLAQLVEAMAPIEPALLESDARAMVAAVQRRVRRRALVVLLTDLNASALDEGLMTVIPQLSAKHQVLLAAVADPRVDGLAAGRADAAQVYDAAAAERARNDRRSIASRLRLSGVDVVDAAPDQLAPALADHYLAMKATGRL